MTTYNNINHPNQLAANFSSVQSPDSPLSETQATDQSIMQTLEIIVQGRMLGAWYHFQFYAYEYKKHTQFSQGDSDFPHSSIFGTKDEIFGLQVATMLKERTFSLKKKKKHVVLIFLKQRTRNQKIPNPNQTIPTRRSMQEMFQHITRCYHSMFASSRRRSPATNQTTDLRGFRQRTSKGRKSTAQTSSTPETKLNRREREGELTAIRKEGQYARGSGQGPMNHHPRGQRPKLVGFAPLPVRVQRQGFGPLVEPLPAHLLLQCDA